jgi:hypothetical protein
MFGFLSGGKARVTLGDSVLLKASSGEYVKVTNNNISLDEAAMPLRMESYFGKSGHITYGDYIFLLTNNEKYISAEEDGTILNTSLTAQQWELFKLVKPESCNK